MDRYTRRGPGQTYLKNVQQHFYIPFVISNNNNNQNSCVAQILKCCNNHLQVLALVLQPVFDADLNLEINPVKVCHFNK
jgi:hypothetical protein